MLLHRGGSTMRTFLTVAILCLFASGNQHFLDKTGGINPQSLLSFPWLGTPRIAQSLAEHSVVPLAGEVYLAVQSSQLIEGPGGSGGGVLGLAKLDPSLKGYVWSKIVVDAKAKTTTLTLYYDPQALWHTSGEMRDHPGRVPLTETTIFYSDHWVQTNAKGTFTGHVGLP
jgi:hypothetical protein